MGELRTSRDGAGEGARIELFSGGFLPALKYFDDSERVWAGSCAACIKSDTYVGSLLFVLSMYCHGLLCSCHGRSLGFDLAVLLDVDVVVGLEDADFVVWELDTGRVSVDRSTGKRKHT